MIMMQRFLNKLLDTLAVISGILIVWYLSTMNIEDSVPESLILEVEPQSLFLEATVYTPRLLDLEYYTTSDFDIPAYLDPNLDASLDVSTPILESAAISISSDLTYQDTLDTQYDSFTQTALTQIEGYMNYKNHGINHPYVDAKISFYESSIKQIQATRDILEHEESFMEKHVLPSELEWPSKTVRF